MSANVSKAARGKQWSFLPSFAVLLPFYLALIYTSTRLHYDLPTPQVDLYAPDGTTPIFSEGKCMEYINHLSTNPDGSPRYRIVGTEEMVESEVYLLEEIEKIKEQVALKMGGLHQIEVWHQIGSGSHLFDFMDKLVWKKYYNITNVIVRLSDGTEASKANAILVNAHLDSTLPSPGAADDLVGVAIQLESLRVIANSPRRLTNSIVFLFNGAEESLQDASHLFITQHPLRHTVRAVINLEACGVGGPEIVFQATSDEMIRALGKTPRPYGTVLATEVFSTGLILSDTDFRQFAAYGNLTGLDMALVQNSYLYHTRQDIPEKIEAGAIQHMGENTLALLNYLTSPETTMGNSPTAESLPKISTSAVVYFSGLGGKLFLVYTRAEATLYYSILVAIVAIVVSDRVDWSRKAVYLAGTIGIGASLIAALIGANLAAAITGVVMDKTLTWFRHEALPILIYGPPAAIGGLLVQKVISKFVRTPNASPALVAEESYLLEHATLIGQLVHYSAALLIGHAFKIASSYLFALSVITALAAVLLNDYVLSRGKRQVHLAAYMVGQIAPLLLGIEGLVGFLDLFVPLCARLGAESPVDFIIASLVCFVGYLTVPMILPLSHRFGSSTTTRIIVTLLFLTAATLGYFTKPSWSVYDHDHPKRLLVLHLENTTTTPSVFHLHIASMDPVPFYDLAVETAQLAGMSTGMIPEKIEASDYNPDWDIIFPVSQFLVSFKVPLPKEHLPLEIIPWSDTFTVSAGRTVLNSIQKTRSVEIIMDHPSIIWPVIAFNADVISWDLPEPAERGLIRHHVKSVAAYGVTRFSLDLVISLSDEEFEAAVREDQRAKGQRADVSAADRELGSLRIDYSGLDRGGMYPASAQHPSTGPGMKFFAEFDKKLPLYVDAMLVSAIAGVAYV